MSDKPEVWLRGPLDNITAFLQPAAHALLQAREELNDLMVDFPGELLWQKFEGLASPGFHLEHLTGVLDRLFTYASGNQLIEEQLRYLAGEGREKSVTSVQLVASFNEQIHKVIAILKTVDEASLKEIRFVGRGMIPSTTIGLYTHAAEHTMRHLGQLLVTVKVLKANTVKPG